ncbi:C6 zinc finger domain protein [Diplogelasinospora grovesii]|uniref:C6 zinc finger domain protein n=1 Tax=Diplogelasinospora grovesii TaxID=303347 RepID=A0AAN6NFG9_9PEZI|nr:C6 zinc finger domain protein [Diplogelasinospora grovesii]
MARKGTQKVKTGCLTCKIRKVKCDEAKPHCARCSSTGRTCDGYAPRPRGVYSWDELLSTRPLVPPPPSPHPPAPALSPVLSAPEGRALEFYRRVVAPVFSCGGGGSDDSAFWTQLVSQASQQEPAVRHAVVAISSIYESGQYGENMGLDPLDSAKGRFALWSYNKALRELTKTTAADESVVLFVCILFVCIETLREDRDAAIAHFRHGVTIFNQQHAKQKKGNVSASAAWARDHLLPMYVRLSIFPFFFGGTVDTFPGLLLDESGSGGMMTMTTWERSRAVLDLLVARCIRFIRSADTYRLGDLRYHTDVIPDTLRREQRSLTLMLDDWLKGFAALVKIDGGGGGLMLHMKCLVAKIWLAVCFDPTEMAYDHHLTDFREIVDLARRVIQSEQQKDPRSPGVAGQQKPRFIFEMGYTPLLYFVVIKCRNLETRLAALNYMAALYVPRENLWDSRQMYSVGWRVIEREHGVGRSTIQCSSSDEINDLPAPTEHMRVKDSIVTDDTRYAANSEGQRVLHRKMISNFLLLVSLAASVTVASAIPTQTAPPNARDTTTPTPTPTVTPSPTETGYFISTIEITIQGFTDDHATVAGQTIQIAIPTCKQTIVPDANGYVPPGTCGAIWDYYPNFAAAVVFTVLFAALTLVHLWQAIRYKKRFCWVIVMAGLWETCAFLFRAISSRYQQSTGVYLIFQIFVLLAPLWVNAFDYMVLGRMIYFFIPSRRLLSVPASTIAAVFVSLDFISFIVQLAGGSMAGPTSPPEDQLRAIHIYMGGIGLQQFFIVVFVGLAVLFQREMIHTEKHPLGYEGGKKPGWRPLLYTLYASLSLITVRIIFRLFEFSRGDDVSNPILTNEVFFYLLEAVPMFLAIASFNFIHPGRVLVGPDSEMPGFFATIKQRCCGGKRKGARGGKLERDTSGGEELSSYHELRGN